ncbi:hypothetical protein H8B09_11245 [Paenibacillus sp. PR3]|uniref:DUF2231 domain-containing protein n=1 Tax=Paenibacillus terricola TaxID=2763503 RepID=A0ABR8MTP3_9BACL|nr:DUF2231 domain-containing protein [Paenibacillus terricola]MBD3919331.1 hypothetical protein [Paenibacillus terricola]
MNEITSHLHPILVHFPIALITAGVIYDLILAFSRKQLPLRQGLWIWMTAACAAWLSVATGPEDDSRGNTTYLDIHSTLADVTAWVVTLLVIARLYMLFRGRDKLVRAALAIYLVVAIAACGLVLGTGYYGGKMVYDNGIGVKVNGIEVNPPIKKDN